MVKKLKGGRGRKRGSSRKNLNKSSSTRSKRRGSSGGRKRSSR